MSDTAYDLIVAAASSYLMGKDAFVNAPATGGSTTTLIDTSLITFGNDNQYQNRWVYFWSGANAGSERFAKAYDGATGTLTFQNALSSTVSAGDNYFLFRDFRFAQWLAFANETVKSLYFPQNVYVQGVTNQYKYSLPTPFSRREWVEAVYNGPYPFRWTDSQEPKIRWFRVNPLDIQGDMAIVLEAALSSDRQLVFQGNVPFAHPHMTPYTFTRSVLVPFGQTVSMSPWRDWIALGMVWRALKMKVVNTTGDAKRVWEDNLADAARSYATACQRFGVSRVGTMEVGYDEPYEASGWAGIYR